MIKVASMGQQASTDKSREMGRSLLESTLWGGLGAAVGWYVMLIWPSLPVFVLITALAALIYGRWIFQGPAVHPKVSMVTCAFLTMLVIVTTIMSTLVQKYGPVQTAGLNDPGATRELDEATLFTIISAAIHAHRSKQ